jgi:hypothetical protein
VALLALVLLLVVWRWVLRLLMVIVIRLVLARMVCWLMSVRCRVVIRLRATFVMTGRSCITGRIRVRIGRRLLRFGLILRLLLRRRGLCWRRRIPRIL